VIVDAIAWAHQAMQPAIALQRELASKVEPAPQEYELVLPNEDIQAVANQWVDGKLGEKIRRPYPERNEVVNEIRWVFHEAMAEQLGLDAEEYAAVRDEYDEAFTLALHNDVRRGIVEERTRPDGRALTEIRPLSSEVGILPRTHGSSLFTRGVTQGMN
ncbi:MAG: hypothetical protein D8B38_06695, partial [Candidatus Saccharimonas sp.]